MFRNKLYKRSYIQERIDLIFNVIFIIYELVAKLSSKIGCAFLVINDMDPPKYYDTLDIKR